MTSIYRNIIIFCSLVFIFVFAAFFKTYFGLFPGFENTDFVVHVHVALILTWFAMLVVQPFLVSRKKIRVHLLIGKFSYVLVPLVVISALAMTRHQQLREKNMVVFMANIVDLSIFIILYLLAIIYRHKASWHGRFMLLTVLPFLSPSAARLHVNGLIIELSIILMLLILERFSSRIYKPYLITLLVFVVIYVSMLIIAMRQPAVIESFWNLCFR